MIADVLIENLLAIEAAALEFNPRGRNVATGPSECGKSTILEALCLLLWGRSSDGKAFPVEAIRDGSRECTAELVMGSGTKVRKTLRRDRKWQAEVTKGGEVHCPTTQEEIAALLGPLGADPEAGRLILVPFAWQALADGKGGGRPFAAFLARILPKGDLKAVVAELMAPGVLGAGDPVDPKSAEQRRATEKTSLAETRGKLAHLREEATAASHAVAVGPSEAEVAEAKAVIAARGKWLAYNQAKIAHDAATANTEKSRRSAIAWDLSLAKLGDEPAAVPKPDDGPAIEAHAAFERAQRISEAADEEIHRTAKARTKAEAGTCSTCKQALPADLVSRMVDAHEAAGAAAKIAAQDAEAAVTHDHEVRAAYDSALAAFNCRRDWLAARKALGPCPEVPAVEPLRTAPAGTEPTQTAIAAAETTLRDAERATGAASEQDRRRQRVAAQLAETEQDERDGSEELLRLERLVDATRRAPAIVASRQLACLGDLGPVKIELPEEGDACVITLDGRPWWLASTGRQIVGDVWLRMGLRRAKRWPWMLMVVDRAQDVGGQEIPDARPCLELLTTGSGELTVSTVGDGEPWRPTLERLTPAVGGA